MSYHIYILYSENLNRYYIGSTGDLKARLEKHSQSKKGFTSKAKDWKLCYKEQFEFKTEALKRELQLKKWKSRKMLEQLISNDQNS